MKTLNGRLQMSAKGFGFVIPMDKQEPDVYIPREALRDSMHGDQVEVRVVDRITSSGRKSEGQIVKVLERAHTHLTGSFVAGRNFALVHPSDTKISMEIYVPKTAYMGAKTGDQVIVEIVKWPQPDKKAEGKVTEVLGRRGEPGVDVLTIIASHQLPREFPASVEKASELIPAFISPSELSGRRDLRDSATVTIDSEDAKDLDDAVHVEAIGPALYRLSVHIADVSHYVRENSVLDLEARQRGTSVYLVDRVIPMLPHRLSNGICSLNGGEDRLTLSASMDIDSTGQITRYEIFPSIIRVRTRLSYTIVRRILADRDPALREEYAPLVPMLETMEKLAAILREKRNRRGAIDFDLPEIKVKLDDQGRTIGLEKRIRTVSESIIEEFMLAANETVAKHMSEQKVPFIYRVHADPDPEKMAVLADLLRGFGLKIGAWKEVKPSDLQQALAMMAGKPEEKMVSSITLRSLKQARYEVDNSGHFGLAAKFYTHFTSPIRRYPDLIVHRLIRETLSGALPAQRQEYLEALLPKIADDSSNSERAATEAERESVDLKTTEYMVQFIGDEFPAVIAGVTAFGFFVELENGVEGLVHISSLDDDYYQYVEDQHCLIGDRLKNRFRLGDPVVVRLTAADPVQRTLDFNLASSVNTRLPKPIGAKKPVPKPTATKGKHKEVKTIAGKKSKHKDRRRKP